MFVDPLGLFDKLTIMGKGSTKTEDIKTLQNKLNELGYTDDTGKALAVDGSFGPSTEQAVNKYKDANGLWNFEEYKGVVGITTWRALGLPVDDDRIYPIYYTTYLVSPYQLQKAGYVIDEDFILYDMGIAAITSESADSIKQFEKEQIDEMVSMCVSSINISGFTKHGLAQVMGRDGGKGVSNAAFLDAIKNPTKVIHQQEGKIKYVGKNATVVLNDVKKVITAWATNSKGVR